MAKDKGNAVDKPARIDWSFKKNYQYGGVPWGPFDPPFYLALDGVKISAEKDGESTLYRRLNGDEGVEKTLLVGGSSIRFSPIEPLHSPAVVSTHLLIEFTRPAIIEPKAVKDFYVTFPLEIATIVERRRKGESVIDIFSLNRAKYTLYGNVKDGLICRYWQSDIFDSQPVIDPLRQGILKIAVQNKGPRWAEVNRTVFSAYGMVMYYSPKSVSLNAYMKIGSEKIAETGFLDKPLQAGMKKATHQFVSKPLSQQGRALMEEGY